MNENDTYSEDLRGINEITRGGLADLVVIGDDAGTGLIKARWIAESMYAKKSLVVWRDPPSNEVKNRFARLGLKYFSIRRQMGDAIREMLGVQTDSSAEMMAISEELVSTGERVRFEGVEEDAETVTVRRLGASDEVFRKKDFKPYPNER